MCALASWHGTLLGLFNIFKTFIVKHNIMNFIKGPNVELDKATFYFDFDGKRKSLSTSSLFKPKTNYRGLIVNKQ